MSHLWKHVVNVSLDLFQRIFLKCCWSGAYLTPRGLALLNEITSLSVLFTSAEHVLTRGPCSCLGPFALVSVSHIAHKSPFLSQNDCISEGQRFVRVESPSVCCETAQRHLSAWFPGPARRSALNRILWTRGFLFKKQEMGVEALGRRHDWMRIQIVWEWENGGLEFGVCFTKSGHPWKCLLGFGVQPPPPPFLSRSPLSLALPRFFLGGARLKTERP